MTIRPDMLVRSLLIAGGIGAFPGAALARTPHFCSVPIGTAVAIKFADLPAKVLGVRYLTDDKWAAPRNAPIGQLSYDWGLMLRADEPRFANFDLSPGPVHSRSSGCWFQWDIEYIEGGINGISNSRIGRSGYRDGYVRQQPPAVPRLSGYRFTAADAVHRDGYTWIGLWVADGVVERSRIVAFNADRHLVLATLPVRLGSLASLPDLHSNAYALTLIGEGKPRQPVPLIRLNWPSGPPVTQTSEAQ